MLQGWMTQAMALVAAAALTAVGGAMVWAQATQPAQEPTGAQATQPAQAAEPPLERLQPADELIRQMLRPAGSAARPLQPVTEPPAPDRTTGRGAVAPGAPMLTVMREGTYIVDRVGRLTRSADGTQMEFTFEADGQALRDPPVIILPNLKLMAMENLVSGSSRDLRFRITGMVTEYRGRNYVLLEKVVVVSDVTQQF
jgi:hypothetical protein